MPAGKVEPVDRPTPFEPCGLARLPLLLLNRAGELGLDRDELLRRAGLAEVELADPDAKVPVRKLWALWRAAIAHTGDEELPLRVIGSTPLRAYGLVGYLMIHSPTLGAAFDRLARYSRIVTDAVAIEWAREPDTGRLTLTERLRGDSPRDRSDARLAFAVVAAREVLGQLVTPLEVHLPYAQPQNVGELRRVLGEHLLFDRPQGALIFAGRDLDLPVVGADATLGAYLDDLAERLLRTLPTADSFQDRVRQALWIALRDGRVDLASVAAHLGVVGRTLQRRLRDGGTSYAAVLDGVRRDLAIGMVRGRDLAVYEVAFLLGYSEPSTFHRAFRCWTGTSPLAYRNAAG